MIVTVYKLRTHCMIVIQTETILLQLITSRQGHVHATLMEEHDFSLKLLGATLPWFCQHGIISLNNEITDFLVAGHGSTSPVSMV